MAYLVWILTGLAIILGFLLGAVLRIKKVQARK